MSILLNQEVYREKTSGYQGLEMVEGKAVWKGSIVLGKGRARDPYGDRDIQYLNCDGMYKSTHETVEN